MRGANTIADTVLSTHSDSSVVVDRAPDKIAHAWHCEVGGAVRRNAAGRIVSTFLYILSCTRMHNTVAPYMRETNTTAGTVITVWSGNASVSVRANAVCAVWSGNAYVLVHAKVGTV